jgi:hypothetical protein
MCGFQGTYGTAARAWIMARQLQIGRHRPRGANEREKKMAKKTLKKSKKMGKSLTLKV